MRGKWAERLRACLTHAENELAVRLSLPVQSCPRGMASCSPHLVFVGGSLFLMGPQISLDLGYRRWPGNPWSHSIFSFLAPALSFLSKASFSSS